MNPSRTLWMGNIEQWMTEEFIINIFSSFKVHPQKINILKNPMEKGCYFIEFLSTEEAVFVYENCNNLQVNNLFIKVKWVKLSQKTSKKKSSKKYSVIINNLI